MRILGEKMEKGTRFGRGISSIARFISLGLIMGTASFISVAAPSAATGATTPTVAFMMPDVDTARWEGKDTPFFTDAMKTLCPNCKVLHYNAKNDAGQQLQQVEAAVTAGAKVLVICPVDGKSISPAIKAAKAKGVSVIAYDRLIYNAPVDYYLVFDPTKVGAAQGQSIVDRLKSQGITKGNIIAINGAPTDSDAPHYRDSAFAVLKSAGFTIAKSYDTPNWDPAEAQRETDQAVTQLGKKGFVAVLTANDGMATAVVKSLQAAGITPIVPVTGQDAELAAIQRILVGSQYMTVYTPLGKEAGGAATLANALLTKAKAPAGLINKAIPNGSGSVPSVFLASEIVTQKTINQTVIAGKFWTAGDICTAAFKNACGKYGIK
jgi:D-xylose transport system substrate-binding protein